MEGDSYCTLSLLSLFVRGIRKNLVKASEDMTIDDDVRQLSKDMLADFNVRWGTGQINTEWGMRYGFRRRLEGIRYMALVAALVDPRTKAMVATLGPDDKKSVEDYVVSLMEAMHVTSSMVVVPATGARPLSSEHQQMLALMGMDNAPNQHPEEERNDIGSAVEELKACKREPVLPLFDANDKYSDPLPWWKLNATKYPRLHAVALQVLQIQATSASSERLFSSAGLTITNDRASLLPQNAAILVFLKGAWAIAEKYEGDKIDH